MKTIEDKLIAARKRAEKTADHNLAEKKYKDTRKLIYADIRASTNESKRAQTAQTKP